MVSQTQNSVLSLEQLRCPMLICDECYYCFSYFYSQSGETALHWASRKGLPKVVQVLVQAHADVNIKDRVSTESPH